MCLMCVIQYNIINTIIQLWLYNANINIILCVLILLLIYYYYSVCIIILFNNILI